MKLSIWRQFSSNNSSSYVIVGAFETPEKAQEAGEKFKALLQCIWEWYQAHPEAREVVNSGNRELTDAEHEIMREYNLEFEEALDWVAREESLDFLPDAVAVFENLVFVATVDETETKDTPLAQYMHQLGADVKLEEAMESYLTIHVSGTAPNDITAQYIKSSAEAFFQREQLWQRPPWIAFYDGQLAPDLEQLSRDVDIFIARWLAWSQWNRDNKETLDDLIKRREAAWRAKDDQSAAALSDQIRTLGPPHPIDNTNRHIHKVLCWTSIDTDDDKTVTVTGNTIKLPNLYFLSDDLGHGLPALVTWMRALGCTDVIYEFIVMPR